LRTARDWEERGVSHLSDRRVTTVDPGNHSLLCADGTNVTYGKLIWSAGANPRRLACSGHDLAGIHTIRFRADVDRLRAELPLVENVVVVGGGYIGLEAAAALKKLDKKVTVVEAQDRVLARVAGKPLSQFYEEEHRKRGVDLHLGAAVAAIEGDRGRTSRVRLAGGQILIADMVIVGIGVDPAVEPLLRCGAEGGNGVRVDEYCRTSLPDIYAIGDCAEHRNAFAQNNLVRLESVQNANDQAGVAAKSIVGQPQPYNAVPWFWSNQFDLRLQTVGILKDFDDLVVRGDPGTRSFSVVYLRQGKVIALDCVNAVRDYSQGRILVGQGVRPDRAALADPSIALKTLLT